MLSENLICVTNKAYQNNDIISISIIITGARTVYNHKM